MATAIDIGTLITKSPEVCGGRPRVAGTGMTVMRIAGWHRFGCNPEEIARKTGLTLARFTPLSLLFRPICQHAGPSTLLNGFSASEYT